MHGAVDDRRRVDGEENAADVADVIWVARHSGRNCASSCRDSAKEACVARYRRCHHFSDFTVPGCDAAIQMVCPDISSDALCEQCRCAPFQILAGVVVVGSRGGVFHLACGGGAQSVNSDSDFTTYP